MKCAALALFAVVSFACASERNPAIDAAVDSAPDAIRDTSNLDARDTALDTPRDNRIDSPMRDTSVDRAVADSRDAHSERTDAGSESDVALDTACSNVDDGGFSACLCLPQPPRCVGTTCGVGRICLDTGCGMRCVRASSSCVVDDDCHEAATCSAVANDESRCLRSLSGCGDSRDCASGFACEHGSCRDRRVSCDSTHACPWGFVCDSVEGSQPYCRKLYPRCVSGSNCRNYEICLDVDGDGVHECAPRGTCTTNVTCRANQRVCGVDPSFRTSNCELRGVCRDDSDCTSGLRCLDTWGDGVKECVRVGSCQRTSDCNDGICGALDLSVTTCIHR